MRHAFRWRAILAVAIIGPMAAGCGDSTKRMLGWEKNAPDEFSVDTRAPLNQPPDYNLRPPSPGATRTAETAPVEQAKKVLIGPDSAKPVISASGSKDNHDLDELSSGEKSLLRTAGAEKATPDVRRQVDEESSALVRESSSFTDDLLFWQDKPKPGEVLDPNKEQKRLEANASLGKPVTEGDTPQIVRKQKGWLEGIF
jgi:hypothetical protein